MATTVIPESFAYVSFDAAGICAIADQLAASIGLADHEIVIEVDESTPLARTKVSIDDRQAIHIRADSGAFEDTRLPRQQSDDATATAVGRMLLRAKDRLTGGFGEAPPDDELSLAHNAAWETYCLGRLGRIGVPINRQRWLYNFRNRHGFTDAGDVAFATLWESDGLTWGELTAISDRAAAAATV
ncbi:MAG: hypothetical protein ABIR32_16995 [Ilumatobacteraceae bacterium]